MPRSRERGLERVHQHEAERRLGLGAAPVQRDRGYDGRGDLVLDQQVADLRAVAVGDDDVDVGWSRSATAAIATSAARDLVLGTGPPVGVSSWRCHRARAGPSCLEPSDHPVGRAPSAATRRRPIRWQLLPATPSAAAGHPQRRAGDVRRLVAHQPGDRVRDLVAARRRGRAGPAARPGRPGRGRRRRRGSWCARCPGATPTTRMPLGRRPPGRGRWSARRHRPWRRRTGRTPRARPRVAAPELTLTSTPPGPPYDVPRARTAARATSSAAVRLRSTVAAITSGGVSASWPRCRVAPALLTTPGEPAVLGGRCEQPVDAVRVGQVGADDAQRAPASSTASRTSSAARSSRA